MNNEELLQLYDLEQRREVSFFGFTREETPCVVRQVSQIDNKSSICYSRLTSATAEAAIADEIEYFSKLGHEFEWKVFAHDEPRDLKDSLIAGGFQPETPDALLVLDLSDVPVSQWQASDIDVRKISEASQLDEVRSVEETVWQEDFSWLTKELSLALTRDPQHLSVYVGYVGNVPVSCAWMRFHPNSQFASLWGGSTLPAFRGRGTYRALVAARAREALARNVRFLTVDASPMSRPILERFGFRLIGFSHPCVWKNDTGQA